MDYICDENIKCWVVTFGIAGNAQDDIGYQVFVNESRATKAYEDWINYMCADVGMSDDEIEEAWNDQADDTFFQDPDGEFWARIEQGKLSLKEN